MLTKKDLEQLDEILKNRIREDVPGIVRTQIREDVPGIVKAAFQDFYDNVFEPYADKNEREHEQIVQEIKAIKKDTEEIKEHIKDHEKRITHLENVSTIKN